MAFDYEKYIRPGKLPHIWCPGCGHGIVMKGLIRAMDTLQMVKENTLPFVYILPAHLLFTLRLKG